MRIGIDISQTAYESTGVGNYLSHLVSKLLSEDAENEYVLFFSSLRRNLPISLIDASNRNPRAKIIKAKIPPTALEFLWNSAHVVPVETFIGKVDLFISSDWTEPPVRHAKKATIIYDLVVLKNPNETDQKIVSVQRRKLEWVKKESNIVFCISKSGKKDVEELLGIDSSKIEVIYPGI